MNSLHVCQLICPIAAVKNIDRVRLIRRSGSTVNETAEASFNRVCFRHITKQHQVFISMVDENKLSYPRMGIVSPEDESSRQTLTVAAVFSVSILKTTIQIIENGIWNALPTILVTKEENFLEVADLLPWQLNNKIISLVVEEKDVSVFDVYRASPTSPPLVQKISQYQLPPSTSLANFDVLVREPWYRRTNLSGLTLQCFALEYIPLAILEHGEEDQVTVKGLYGELWDIIKSVSNLRTICRNAGHLNFEKVYQTVSKGVVDISLPVYGMFSHRLGVTDFAYGASKMEYYLVVQKSEQDEGAGKLLKEFSWGIWISFAGFYFLSIITMLIFNNWTHHNTRQRISDIIFQTSRIFCNIGITSTVYYTLV